MYRYTYTATTLPSQVWSVICFSHLSPRTAALNIDYIVYINKLNFWLYSSANMTVNVLWLIGSWKFYCHVIYLIILIWLLLLVVTSCNKCYRYIYLFITCDNLSSIQKVLSGSMYATNFLWGVSAENNIGLEKSPFIAKNFLKLDSPWLQSQDFKGDILLCSCETVNIILLTIGMNIQLINYN